MKKGYDKRVVAFLDILGFKNIIKDTETDTKKFEDLVSLFHRIKDGIEKLSTENENPTDIRMSVFSDSIIISAAITSNADIFATQLLKINIWLIEQGYFVRGGVDYGEIYHQENIVFGPAFINAYELEKLADYPRIVLSEKAKEVLHHKKSLDGEKTSIAVSTAARFFEKDFDGMYYVNYLIGESDDEKYQKFLNVLEGLINKNINANQGNISVIKKMQWIKNKICLFKKEQGKPKTIDDFLSKFGDVKC